MRSAGRVRREGFALAVRRHADGLVLEVQGLPGRQPVIECAKHRVSGPWLRARTLLLDSKGLGITWIGAGETEPMRFYRA